MDENSLRKIKILFIFLLVLFGITAGVYKQLQQLNEAEIIENKQKEEQEALLQSIKKINEDLERQEHEKRIAELNQIKQEKPQPAIFEDETSPTEEANINGEEEIVSVALDPEALEKGLEEEKNGDYKRAIEHFEIAIKDPNKEIQKVAYEHTIACYTQLNDTYGKIKIYKNMIASEKDGRILDKVYEKLAEEYNKLEDWEKSLEYYAKSYKIEPTTAKAKVICDTYLKINKTKDMKAFIDWHLSKFPDDSSEFVKYTSGN